MKIEAYLIEVILNPKYLYTGSTNLSPVKYHAMWNALALTGEAAEVLSLINNYGGYIDNYSKMKISPTLSNDIILELGDVLYYLYQAIMYLDGDQLNLTATGLAEADCWDGLELDSFTSLADFAIDLSCEIGLAAEMIQKLIFLGSDIKPEDLYEKFSHSIELVACMARILGVEYGDILEGNKRKIESRYPDGFILNIGEKS